MVNFEKEIKDQYDKVANEPGSHSKRVRMNNCYPSFKRDLNSNLMNHTVKIVNEMRNFEANLIDISNQPLKMVDAFASEKMRIIKTVKLELSKFKISVQKMEIETVNIDFQVRQTFVNKEIKEFSPNIEVNLSDVHHYSDKLKYRTEYDVINPQVLNDVVPKLTKIMARADEIWKQMRSEKDDTKEIVKEAIGFWTLDEVDQLKEEKSLAISFCYDMYDYLKNYLVDIEVINSNEMMQELESLEVLIEKNSLCKAEKCNRKYHHFKDSHCPYCHKNNSYWEKTNEFKLHLKECLAKKKYDQLISDGIDCDE